MASLVHTEALAKDLTTKPCILNQKHIHFSPVIVQAQMFQNILEDVTQQFLCGMTIKPLQGYFRALFNVNQRLQNPGIKESLKDKKTMRRGEKMSISIPHSWKQKGFSAFLPW